MKYSLDGRTIVITGASVGIGAAFARRLAPRAKKLILVARSRERLEELAQSLAGECEIAPCDLGAPAELERLIDRLRGQEIDVLINNAGIGLSGRFAEADEERLLALIELNVVALVRLTRAVLPAMIERGHGAVYNVGSIAGVQGCPFMALYGGTKSFVNDFTEALATELRGTGVSAGVLLPGSTRTDFFRAGGIPDNRVSKYFQTAEAVAKTGAAALERRRAWRVSGWPNRAMVFAQRLLPRSVVQTLARWTLGGLAGP